MLPVASRMPPSDVDDLEAAARPRSMTPGIPYRVLSGTARNFEYYSGVTFRFRSGGRDRASPAAATTASPR
jgi:hypothetical protein